MSEKKDNDGVSANAAALSEAPLRSGPADQASPIADAPAHRLIKFRFWSGDRMFYKLGNVSGCLSQQMAAWEQGSGFVDGVPAYDHVKEHGAAFLQFTGLFDKNGHAIYEGDVRREEVEHDEGDERLYFICIWLAERAQFAWVTPAEYGLYQGVGISNILDENTLDTFGMDEKMTHLIVVVGNIYENPELLTL